MSKQPISTEPSLLNVTYLNEDYTNNLWGDYLVIEKTESGFTLSMDMGRNQEAEPNTNTSNDVIELLGNVDNIDFIQVSEESAVERIRRAMSEAPERKWALELRFLNGGTHSLPIGPDVDDSCVFLRVLRP